MSKELYDEAFALLKRAQELLEAARQKHEQASPPRELWVPASAFPNHMVHAFTAREHVTRGGLHWSDMVVGGLVRFREVRE